MEEPWFEARRYGIGWTPTTSAGWISSFVFLVLLQFDPVVCRWLGAPVWVSVAFGGVICVGFIALTVLKGDGRPLKWRWGRL